ncbi:general secretion pathway protein GspK [Hydrogenophaga sp. PAMC20947]|nr:general secretion pathway protein GspK [Hydrogenophaga sp. PAMC20947]
MLVVTLVATLASAALWQQWRSAAVEAAERQRVQASWILTGALDWARLILREDARSNRNSGNADHLGEPWATPLEEAQLSSFLAADKDNNADDLMPAYLSGEIVDAQSRLNVMNLIKTSGEGADAKVEISEPDLAAFTKLYQLLDLPAAELSNAAESLVATTRLAQDDPMPSSTPILPMRFAQLSWLGFSEGSLKALSPHVGVLPERTPLNLNTASAEALSASIPQIDLAMAQQLVSERANSPFKDLLDVISRIPGAEKEWVNARQHDVRSRFFEVHVRMRLDDHTTEERSLVVRSGLNVGVRWRERVATLP